MDSLAQFHFLRPWALLLVLLGTLLYPLWRWFRARRNLLTSMIAPHLLAHLLLPADRAQRFSPIHGVSALLIITGLAIAGPTWDKVLPAFADEQTRVSILLDLSPSMAGKPGKDTLALAQERILALAQQQPGWQLGLVAYASSAHLVMPNSRDAELLKLYLNSLEAGLIPGAGRNLSAALSTALENQTDSSAPLTLILFTDNLGSAQLAQSPEKLPSKVSVLVLAPAETLASAGPALAALGADSRALATQDEDVRWLERRVQSHFSRQQSLDDELKWRDAGYWLVWPLLLLTLLSARRGWRLQWCLLPFVLLLHPLPAANAGPLADAFLTADQQGRLAFEDGQYARAARLFADPYLRGLSAYNAADLPAAMSSLKQVDSAAAWFYLGNSYARQMEFDKAQIAYQKALEKQPDLAPAKANLALVTRLAQQLEDERKQAPPMDADELRFDQEAGQGVLAEQQQEHLSDEIWLQNLNISATDFLRRKFAIEQRIATGAAP